MNRFIPSHEHLESLQDAVERVLFVFLHSESAEDFTLSRIVSFFLHVLRTSLDLFHARPDLLHGQLLLILRAESRLLFFHLFHAIQDLSNEQVYACTSAVFLTGKWDSTEVMVCSSEARPTRSSMSLETSILDCR